MSQSARFPKILTSQSVRTIYYLALAPSNLKHLQVTAVTKLGNYGTVSYLTFFEDSRRVFSFEVDVNIYNFEANIKVGEMTYAPACPC